jgi:predicted ATPase with chaperone activity
MGTYINDKAVRELALHCSNSRWGTLPYGKRVSKRFLDRIDSQVRVIVTREVYHHPSKGRTLV